VTRISAYRQFYLTDDGTAGPEHILTGKTAYSGSGKVTGSAYTPAMMQFDGSTGYFNKTSGITTSTNKFTFVMRFVRESFTTSAETPLVFLGPTFDRRPTVYFFPSNDGTIDRRDRISVLVHNSSGVAVCWLFSSIGYLDGNSHTLFFSYDGDAGAATFVIDGTAEDDTDNGERVAPTTATLDSGANSPFGVGAWTNGTNPTAGQLGFVGYREAYLTNWSAFMFPDGRPKALDESTWTEWGAQPLFWNEHGDMNRQGW
jgi:hypothetical protein